MLSGVTGSISGFLGGVRNQVGAATKANFGHTENLFELVAACLKFGGEISEKVLSQVEGYLLVMKCLEMPTNLQILFWNSAPSVSYFTMNIAALKEGLVSANLGLTDLTASPIVEELLKVTDKSGNVKAYYRYNNEDHFREYLVKKLQDSIGISKAGLEAQVKKIDLKLVQNNDKLHLLSNESLHKIAAKCFALGSILIPIAWFASVGGFGPAIQGLSYVAGSLAKYQVFGVAGQMAASLPMVRILETAVLASFVTGFALKTWAAVRVYFAQAEDLQRSTARNSAIDNFLYGLFCFVRLTGGNSDRYGPIATGVHFVHDLAAPKMRDVKEAKV